MRRERRAAPGARRRERCRAAAVRLRKRRLPRPYVGVRAFWVLAPSPSPLHTNTRAHARPGGSPLKRCLLLLCSSPGAPSGRRRTPLCVAGGPLPTSTACSSLAPFRVVRTGVRPQQQLRAWPGAPATALLAPAIAALACARRPGGCRPPGCPFARRSPARPGCSFAPRYAGQRGEAFPPPRRSPRRAGERPARPARSALVADGSALHPSTLLRFRPFSLHSRPYVDASMACIWSFSQRWVMLFGSPAAAGHSAAGGRPPKGGPAFDRHGEDLAAACKARTNESGAVCILQGFAAGPKRDRRHYCCNSSRPGHGHARGRRRRGRGSQSSGAAAVHPTCPVWLLGLRYPICVAAPARTLAAPRPGRRRCPLLDGFLRVAACTAIPRPPCSTASFYIACTSSPGDIQLDARVCRSLHARLLEEPTCSDRIGARHSTRCGRDTPWQSTARGGPSASARTLCHGAAHPHALTSNAFRGDAALRAPSVTPMASARPLPALAAVANAVLKSAAGEEVRAGTLWAQSPVLVFALRRPGCVLCRDAAQQVRGGLRAGLARGAAGRARAGTLACAPSGGRRDAAPAAPRAAVLGGQRAVCGGWREAGVRGARVDRARGGGWGGGQSGLWGHRGRAADLQATAGPASAGEPTSAEAYRACLYAHKHTHARTHTRTRTHAHAHTHTHTHTTHTQTRTHARTHTHHTHTRQ
jgi:hypothetical protein